MAKLFCSIDTPQRQELINKLKNRFPNKSEVELITEINTASQELAIGGEIPTIEQMNQYYSSKNIYNEGEYKKAIWPRDERLVSLYNKSENGNVRIADLLSLIDSDSEFSGIIDLLKSRGKSNGSLLYGVKVKLDFANTTGMYDTSRAYYDAGDKTIHINYIAGFENGRADSVILHEVLHAITVNKILSNKTFRAEFDSIIDKYLESHHEPSARRRYAKEYMGEQNPHYMEEFIADVWSNRDLIDQLKAIKSTKNLTLWDRIKQFFTKIFAGSDNALLADASDAIYRLLDQPEIASNGNRDNIFREGQSVLEFVDQSVLDEVATKTFASTQQREDRVMLVARMISNTATQMIADSGTDADRKEYITEHINEIVDSVRSSFSDEIADEIYSTDDGRISKNYTQEEFRNEFKKVRDCWQTVIEEASNVLFVTEGIQINIIDGSAYEPERNEGDLTGNDYDTRDNEEEGEAAGKDGWMVKAREVDLRDTLSRQVRKALNTIEKTDRNGNVEYDDLGFPRYLDQDYAHIKLLEAISTINNSDEFDAALNGMVERNPWVANLIKTLDKDTTLKAKFYQDLRKEFVPYWIQLADGQTKQVNVEPSRFYFGREWQYNQEQANILDKDSLYTNKGTFNKRAAAIGIKMVDSMRSQLNDHSASRVISDNIDDIRKGLAMIGVDFTNDTIWDALTVGSDEENINKLLGALQIIYKGVNDGLPDGTILYDEYKSQYNNIADLFSEVPIGTTLASFRENGKSYQSYANPSYLGRLLNGLKSSNFKSFIESEYGQTKQFFDNGEFKPDWLRKLYSSKKYGDMLDRKVVLNARFGNKVRDFDDWTEEQYLNVMMNEFFSDPSNKVGEKYAYYYVPLLADSPSCEFLKFVRYTNTTEKKKDGTYRTMEECIIPKLADVVEFELDRIALIKRREQSGTIKIESFDTAGKRILFFPELNNRTYENGKTFFQKYADLKTINDSEARDFIEQEVASLMNDSYKQFEVDAAKLGQTDAQKLREFFYNNALAYTQIVALTTTDLAYYKSLNDFQKRYKEVYAMTARLYTNSKYGKKSERYVILQDYKMPSKVIDEVSQALDKAIVEKRITKIDKDFILSQYKSLNIADAQAYRSLESYRSILDMSGEWTDEMERAYENITSKDAKWGIEDFNILWQSIKPFTFSQVFVDSQVEGYGSIKVPVQHKTAEYLLLAIYEKIAQNLNKSPMLTSMGEFMEKNGIDLVLFESAVKVGSQGKIQLPIDGTKEDYDNAFNSAFNADGTINNQVVHEISFEDFGIITRNPEHLYDHDDVIGSQFRRLIDADLPDNAKFTVGGKQYTKNEIHELYQGILTSNIIDSFKEVSETFSNVENIEKAIQKEMAGNNRYSDEDRKACTLVQRNGQKVFQIPLYDPIQSQRIQQLLNSIIKKKVTKQSIKRASCVQVSSVGLTDELQVRYQDADGNLLFTQSEWDNAKRGTMPRDDYKRLKEAKKKYKSWSDYKTKAAAQAYWEAYLPAWSKKFFGILDSSDGNFVDISQIPDGLRKAIGLRIPTEAKYSMQPIYVKGFLPQSNGSTIMLPADIVKTTGSDFDFDKVYVYFKEFKTLPNLQKEWDKLSPLEKEKWGNNKAETSLMSAIFGEEIDLPNDAGFISWMNYLRDSEPERYKKLVKDNKRIVEVKYDYDKSPREQSKEARNNAILDIAFAILTNSSVIEQVQKPGGFDEARRVAAIVDILRTEDMSGLAKLLGKSNSKKAMSKLFSLDMDSAEDYAKKARGEQNPLSPITQTYFHAQNANGGKMIGIYAVGNASHASGQWANTRLRQPIKIFGKNYQVIDRMLDDNNQYISNVLAQFLAASVDNVKQPVLKSLSQDTSVGDITNLMARLGVSIFDIGLVMSAPTYGYGIIADPDITPEKIAWAISVASKDSLTPAEHKALMEMTSSAGTKNANAINQLQQKSNISYEDRVRFNNIMVGAGDILSALAKASKELTNITQNARGESLANAAGPTIADNFVRQIRLQKYREQLLNPERLIDTNILDIDFILNGRYNEDEIYNRSMQSGVPFLQAATKCGVVGTGYLLNKLFPQTKDSVSPLLLDENKGLFRYVNTEFMRNEDFAKLVNAFYNDLYLYVMSQSSFFGGSTIRQNYSEFLKDFPQTYKNVIAKHPELNSNGFIRKLAVVEQNGINKIVFKDSGNLSKTQQQRLSNDWTQLAVSGNEEIKNLGISLFRYATLNGLVFDGPQSFIQLVPNVIKRAVPDYVNSLDMLLRYDNLNLEPFVEQFVRNRLGEFSARVEMENVTDNQDGTITVPNNKVVQRREKTTAEDGKIVDSYKNWKFIKIQREDDSAYEYYRELSRGDAEKTITYERITKLGIPHTFKEYYYGEGSPKSIVGNKTSAKTDAPNQPNEFGDEHTRGEETVNTPNGISSTTLLNNVPQAIDKVTGKPIC